MAPFDVLARRVYIIFWGFLGGKLSSCVVWCNIPEAAVFTVGVVWYNIPGTFYFVSWGALVGTVNALTLPNSLVPHCVGWLLLSATKDKPPFAFITTSPTNHLAGLLVMLQNVSLAHLTHPYRFSLRLFPDPHRLTVMASLPLLALIFFYTTPSHHADYTKKKSKG